jgi:hypothetical protein
LGLPGLRFTRKQGQARFETIAQLIRTNDSKDGAFPAAKLERGCLGGSRVRVAGHEKQEEGSVRLALPSGKGGRLSLGGLPHHNPLADEVAPPGPGDRQVDRQEIGGNFEQQIGRCIAPDASDHRDAVKGSLKA